MDITRRTVIAPDALVAEVARRSGRTYGTVLQVIYGKVTSAPVQFVIDEVRKELNLPDPRISTEKNNNAV